MNPTTTTIPLIYDDKIVFQSEHPSFNDFTEPVSSFINVILAASYAIKSTGVLYKFLYFYCVLLRNNLVKNNQYVNSYHVTQYSSLWRILTGLVEIFQIA